MKIYFAGSIRGGREDKYIYFEIIKLLQKYGMVLTEHVGNTSLFDKGENVNSEDIYERDIRWIEEADIIIAEVTKPSLGVGYEIGFAESRNKKIICLYREIEPNKKISAMIAGNSNIRSIKYNNTEELDQVLSNLLVK